jgi:hypothetical protein
MSRRPTKVQRLVRLNQFREDLASGALRQAISEQLHAEENHQSATGVVDQLGQWKARSFANGGLDLGLYDAVLELEHRAMNRADELHQSLRKCEQRTDQAQGALNDAASATRASENRGRRELTAAKSTQEKRVFDQISDLLLSTREVRHD